MVSVCLQFSYDYFQNQNYLHLFSVFSLYVYHHMMSYTVSVAVSVDDL